jgi:hypothetical protein
MAVVTAASTQSGQGIISVFKIAAVSDADTFVGPSSPKAFWAFTTADPTTNTSAGINVTESSGTYTFYPGIDALACTLFVIN